MRVSRVVVLAATVTAAAGMPAGARGAEVGVGVATGNISCDRQRSSASFASDRLLYGDTWRSVTAEVAAGGDCRESGALILGEATLTGDGIACGTDPFRPFTGYFALTTTGHHLVAGFFGSCVVDGVERSSRFALNGPVVAGRFAGYLLPTGDWPVFPPDEEQAKWSQALLSAAAVLL